MRKKVVIEVLYDAPLRGKIKVDQHVATEDDVKAFHECHTSVVRQIETTEGDAIEHLRLDMELLAGGDEILLAVVGR
jgi:hypothetical protein